MAEKKKNFRRRLIILCAATALLFAAAGGFYAYRKHRIYKQFMAWRAEGMDAAAKNDRITALYPPRPGLKGDRVLRRLLKQDRLRSQAR